MSKKNTNKSNAVVAPSKVAVVVAPPVETKKTQNKNVAVFIVKGAAEDSLNGRIGARTHSMHVVLLDAARVGALLSTKECERLASIHLGAECKAGAAHFNTMKKREFIIRENGAWRLTDEALALCGAKWAQDVVELTNAPKAKKNAKK